MLLITITSLCADGLWLNAVHCRATEDSFLIFFFLIEHLCCLLYCHHNFCNLEVEYGIILRKFFFSPNKNHALDVSEKPHVNCVKVEVAVESHRYL